MAEAQGSGAGVRHLTVSAFVSHEGRTLLHFHALNQMWLPPGGHVDANEDPPQAALREALEETGLAVTILPTSEPFDYETPAQLPPPVTIMVESIADHPRDGAHEHIDCIYFTRPRVEAGATVDAPEGWVWVDAETLRSNRAISPKPDAAPVHIPEDVRVLGLAAIARVEAETMSSE